MEYLLPFEDTLSNVVFIGVLTGVLLASLTLSGWCMQFANRICGGSEAGFFWSLFAYFTSWFGGTLAMAIAVYMERDASPMLHFTYWIIGSVVAIMLVLLQNPWRAFETYVVFSLTHTLSHCVLVLGVLFLLYCTVPEAKGKQLAQQYSTIAAKEDSESIGKLRSWATANENGKQGPEGEKQKTQFKASPVGVNTNPYVQ